MAEWAWLISWTLASTCISDQSKFVLNLAGKSCHMLLLLLLLLLMMMMMMMIYD